MSQFTAENTGVPRVPKNTHFSPPTKRIYDSQGLQAFQHSMALSELQQSLGRIVFLVEGLDVPEGLLPVDLLYDKEDQAKYATDLSVAIPQFEKQQNELETILQRKPYVAAVVELLSRMSQLVDHVPPYPGPRRYGNMACREWHTKLEESIDEWMNELILPLYKLENSKGFLEEVKWYIVNAFGSKERLDYGTGHELAFLAFLTGLWKTRVFGDDVDGVDFLVMFGTYYNLVRKLILTYTLEPAGSHGVWGLDDHFHIIYIIGASQMLSGDSLKNGPSASPKLISNRSVVYHYSSRNFYFNAIAFIYKVKKGSFFEHSPLLYDVSNVKNWEKILKGMLKMYQVEVFGKFPVVQHFYFGSVLFPWTNSKTGKPLPISTSGESIDKEHKEEPQSTTIPMPVTSAPWKKQPSSFQEDVTRTTTMGRTAPSGAEPTTRAPWSQSTQAPNTRAPWSKPGTVPNGSNVPTTKAPWAK